jgi:uncharacterized membrane protein
MKKIILVTAGIIIFSAVIATFFYNIFPNTIATHWDSQGNVNGYMSKFWGLFLVPIIMLGLFLLFSAIPYIDPLKKNIKKFKKQYDILIMILMLFLFYIYILTIIWNWGYKINLLNFILPGFAVLFYYIGSLLRNTKRNYFIGIRTPWTLSSDYVWDKTHKLGSKLFKLSAIISLIGLIFPKYSIGFILVPIIASAIYLVIYSYLIYPKKK